MSLSAIIFALGAIYFLYSAISSPWNIAPLRRVAFLLLTAGTAIAAINLLMHNRTPDLFSVEWYALVTVCVLALVLLIVSMIRGETRALLDQRLKRHL